MLVILAFSIEIIFHVKKFFAYKMYILFNIWITKCKFYLTIVIAVSWILISFTQYWWSRYYRKITFRHTNVARKRVRMHCLVFNHLIACIAKLTVNPNRIQNGATLTNDLLVRQTCNHFIMERDRSVMRGSRRRNGG